SLTSFTGAPKAALKSKPTQPGPRFGGFAIRCPSSTGPGTPKEITSYCQSAASFFTPATIFSGVRPRPDGNFNGCLWPLASILTLFPPTSITSTFIGLPASNPYHKDALAKWQDVVPGAQHERPV